MIENPEPSSGGFPCSTKARMHEVDALNQVLSLPTCPVREPFAASGEVGIYELFFAIQITTGTESLARHAMELV